MTQTRLPQLVQTYPQHNHRCFLCKQAFPCADPRCFTIQSSVCETCKGGRSR